MLTPGEPAPWFIARSTVNPTFQFETVAGRYIVLCFFGSAGEPESQRVLAEIDRLNHGFDVENYVFFGVSTDPDDERMGRVSQRWPGVMFFWDFDRTVSRLYGVAAADGTDYRRQTIVLDQGVRTLAVFPFDGDGDDHIKTVFRFLGTLPPMKTLDGLAPVLVVPNVFDPSFCRSLIDLYDRHGGLETGYMKEIDGKTVPVLNYNYKRRSDYVIVEEDVTREVEARLRRCLIPEIKKAFQFDATHLERYLIACYDAATGGFFKRHRDHTTKGTMHRRFAVTINLNAEEYEGGDLRFPEYGTRLYRAPTGGAVVFSCVLSHEVQRMTRGKRYAFLPFLHDDEAEKVREANLPFLDTSTVRVQS
jgi:peroxiredoxin/predicted 2-oxoglutarate/Fe(II)-dependent dioxygenase YbiX